MKKTDNKYFFQSFRGLSINTFYGDESYFLNVEVFPEILPMLTLDKGRVILMSSHKLPSESKQVYMDLDSLRCDEVLFNSVTYVCSNHQTALLQSDINIANCICKIFAPPSHIDNLCAYRDYVHKFVRAKQGFAHDGSDGHESLLAEIGCIPNATNSTNKNVNLNLVKLTNTQSEREIVSKLFPISDYINGIRNDMYVSTTMTVYYDPATCNSNSSYNALCFMAKITEGAQSNKNEYDGEDDDKSKSIGAQHYVILAVEDFPSSFVDPDQEDCISASVQLILDNLLSLHQLYNGYFKDVIIAPESNSIGMERFCYLLKEILDEHSYLLKKLTIHITTVPAPISNSEDMLHRAKHYASINNIPSSSRFSTTNKCRKRPAKQVRVKPGFFIGSNKVNDCFYFYAEIFNRNRLHCSSTLISQSLDHKQHSIPLYIVNKLRSLEVRKRPQTGSFYISGKHARKSHSEEITDDLAISIIMSVMVFKYVERKQFLLIKIDPTISDHIYDIYKYPTSQSMEEIQPIDKKKMRSMNKLVMDM